MSTTKILSQLQADLKGDKNLENYLPILVAILHQNKKVVFKNMNNKQKLSQMQQFIEGELKNISKSLSESKIQLEDQGNEEDMQEEDEEQKIENNENQMQDEGIENESEEEKQEDQQKQQEELQENVNDNDNEFEEPQFSKKALKNNKEPTSNLQNQDQQEIQQQENQQQEIQGEEGSEPIGSQQQDVGLYGEELNENDQDMEAYDNQFDQQQFKEFQKQYGTDKDKLSKTKKRKDMQQEQDFQDNVDQNIEDNFDHFRQIQIKNQKQQVTNQKKTQLDQQIDKLENKIIGKKDWTMQGQIKAKERPANSLLQFDLQFNSGIKYTHQITQQRNTELQQLIKKRILTDMFDDRARFAKADHIRQHFGSLKQVSRQKSQMGLGELYENHFKNFLGIGDNKNDKLKTQIMDSFKQLNYYLDSLTNFNFVPKPSKQNTKKGQSQAIIVEQKVPLTLWNGQRQIQKEGKKIFESQKQVDNQAKRLKNKRIARQRKKQQMKKSLNKKIEYGGITKFEAQAKQKALMNNKPLQVDGANMKYNKSSSFFKNMNQSKGGKPNPDISKMKI